MGFAAGVLAAAAIAAGSAGGSSNGVNLTAYQHDGFHAPATTQALGRLRELGLTRVAVVVTWYVDDLGDSTIAPDPERTPTDASVAALVRAARAAGMWVIVKPQVDVRDGSFRGDMLPLDPVSWWATYGAMIDRYATIADRNGADALTVGVELRSMSPDVSGFEQVIAAARARFDGQLTYAANWDEVPNVGFWPSLDAIGVDAYYPLARRPGASVEALRRAWRPHVEALGHLSSVLDRPVLLTELGYAARPHAAVDPSGAGRTLDPVDEEAQARAYEAAVLAWRDVPWLQGILWWDWPIDARDVVGDAYTPRGRPAEALLAGPARPAAQALPSRILDAIPWPLLVIVAVWIAVGAGFLVVLRAAERDREAEAEARRPEAPPPPRDVPAPPTGSVVEPPRWRRFARRRPPGDEEADAGHPGPTSAPALAAVVPPPAHDPPVAGVPGGLDELLEALGPPDVGRLLVVTREVLGADACELDPHDTPREPADGRIWAAQASTPVLVAGRSRGALVVHSADPERVFGDRDLALLGVMAELIAATLGAPAARWPSASARTQIEALEATLAAGHDRRGRLAVTLARTVAPRVLPRDDRAQAELVLACRLHDVGMLRVPKARLRRPAPLPAVDSQLVEGHAAWGSELLAGVPGLGGVAALVRFHHEQPDGRGYPHRLAGPRIPRGSLVVGGCAAWAAIVAGGPHVAPRSPEEAVAELRRHAGTQFDPVVVEAIAAASALVPVLRVTA